MADTQAQYEASRGESEGEQTQRLGAVFYVTVAISAAFVLWGVLFTENLTAPPARTLAWFPEGLGWLYMLITTFFLGFVIYLAFSRYGKIKLGQPDDEPEFGYFAWFAMLFQAGMGIGLVFWGVAEPLTHYNTPPLGLAEPRTRARRRPPPWLCRPRSFTGACILGRCMPPSGWPSRTSPTAGACRTCR